MYFTSFVIQKEWIIAQVIAEMSGTGKDNGEPPPLTILMISPPPNLFKLLSISLLKRTSKMSRF